MCYCYISASGIGHGSVNNCVVKAPGEYIGEFARNGFFLEIVSNVVIKTAVRSVY